MRVWFIRLRTILAIIAVALLLWELPVAYDMITTPAIDPRSNAKPAIVLRIWVCEEWTGTGMQWIIQQANAFEKVNRGTRVVVRRCQKDDWLEKDAIKPDVLLFEAGIIKEPDTLFVAYTDSFPVRNALLNAGDYKGCPFALPLCYGGTVRIVNETKPEGITLIMEKEQDFQDFLSEKASALIASGREARRLSAMQSVGKGFPYYADPYGAITKYVLFAGQFPSNQAREEKADAFIHFLRSDAAQNALPALGLLPASKTADCPDESKQPLLFALEKEITEAVNAFD